LIRVSELCQKKWFVGSADAVQRPKGAELDDNVALLFEQFAQQLFGLAEFTSSFGPSGKFETRLTREPFIRLRVQLDQFARAQFCDLSNFALFGLGVTDFVDAATGAMDACIFVTFARIAPIENEHAAVRAIADFHSAEPWVGGNEEVRAMFANVTAAAAFQNFLIGAPAMQIEREK